jgi:hypothetical protein
VGVGPSQLCGSTSSTKQTDWFVNMTAWKKFGNNGIYVDIDTTGCSFATTPYYVVSRGHFTTFFLVVAGARFFVVGEFLILHCRWMYWESDSTGNSLVQTV